LDVDIFIEATPENAQKTIDALQDFGYDLIDLPRDVLLTKKVLIRQYTLETDIHPFVTGVTFEDVWNHRVEDKIGETPAYFASLTDLIRMKEAAGRPKDMDDLRALRKLQEAQETRDADA
jgi:hypothetical protein